MDIDPMTRGVPRVGGRVVSVRLDDELIDQLNDLASHTGRSRGFYLRAAIAEMLPTFRERYWSHDAESRRRLALTYLELFKQLEQELVAGGIDAVGDDSGEEARD